MLEMCPGEAECRLPPPPPAPCLSEVGGFQEEGGDREEVE